MHFQSHNPLLGLLALTATAVSAQQCKVQGFTDCTASQVQSIINTIQSYDASTTFEVPVNQTCYVTDDAGCKLAIDNYDENNGATVSTGAVRGSLEDIVKSCNSNEQDFSGVVDLYGIPVTVELAASLDSVAACEVNGGKGKSEQRATIKFLA